MKWYYLNDPSFLGRSPDSCVYWDVELISPNKFFANFYIHVPSVHLCISDFVHFDCKLFGKSPSTKYLKIKFIQHGAKLCGWHENAGGCWWLVKCLFCLNKDIAIAVKFCNADSNKNKNKNNKMNKNYMELHLKLSKVQSEWVSSLEEWENNGDNELNCVHCICDKHNQLLKYRINFLANDIKIGFQKDFMLCQLIKTTIIKCIEKLLNSHYVYNFDWLKILLQYISLDAYQLQGKDCNYNDRYKHIKFINNAYVNSHVFNKQKVTKQRKQFNNNNNNNSNNNNNNNNNSDKWKVELNSDLYDSLIISNSKYDKNRYKSSQITKKYLNKKVQNRKHKMKKACKNKDKHNFIKNKAREIDGYHPTHCDGCHVCCDLTYLECGCYYCMEAYREQIRLKEQNEIEMECGLRLEWNKDKQLERELKWLEQYLIMENDYLCSNITEEQEYQEFERECMIMIEEEEIDDFNDRARESMYYRQLMLDMKEEEQRGRELKLELETERFQQYLQFIKENDDLNENITDAAFNVCLNEKYSNNCCKSMVIRKNIANKRKNKDKIKMTKMEKMKRKKNFLRGTKKRKIKYKNKYPKKVNHFDF